MIVCAAAHVYGTAVVYNFGDVHACPSSEPSQCVTTDKGLAVSQNAGTPIEKGACATPERRQREETGVRGYVPVNFFEILHENFHIVVLFLAVGLHGPLGSESPM